MDKNKCINSCSNDITHIYQYENICYTSCPNGTLLIDNNKCIKCNNYYNYEQNDCLNYIPLGYYLNDSIKKTIDKCNIKCNNCSLDSELNNLCISCNNSAGYYAKYNDSLNDNIFAHCYSGEQLGYYLEQNENLYYPCYSTCKSCSGKGNRENNKCYECISKHILINSNCHFILDSASENSYTYEIHNNLTEQKDIYKNITFINFLEGDIDFFIENIT